MLVARTSDNLRVARVTQRVNADSREVFDLVYAESHQAVRAASDAIVAMESDEPVQILRMGSSPMMICTHASLPNTVVERSGHLGAR